MKTFYNNIFVLLTFISILIQNLYETLQETNLNKSSLNLILYTRNMRVYNIKIYETNYEQIARYDVTFTRKIRGYCRPAIYINFFYINKYRILNKQVTVTTRHLLVKKQFSS